MYESKARTGFYPDDAEAQQASHGPGRRNSAHLEDDSFRSRTDLRAANSDDPRDAQLRALLRRRLDGDPYPVSGGRAPAPEEAPPAQPLAEHIGSILSRRYAEHKPAGKQPLEPAADLLEFVPDLLDGGAEPFEHIAEPALPEPSSRFRKWSLSLRSLGFVIATALVGAAIPTMLASPPLYMSQAFLHAEGEGRVRQAVLDVAAKRVVTPATLSDVVARLKLDRNPEFSGSRAGALGVAIELLSGSGNASDAPSRAQAALRRGVAVGIDDATGLLRLSVTSGDPLLTAEIANRLAVAAIYDAAVVQAAGASGAGGTAVDRSRKELDRASAALASFKAQYGEDKITAAVALQQQRQQLDNDIKAAELALRSARANVSAAKAATPASLMSGALPPDLAAAGLDDIRSRYSAAQAQLAQLAIQLGPRHPRLLAQQAIVNDLAAGIRSQLQRLVVSSDAALKAARAQQDALSARMTALSQKGIDVDIAHLTQLQEAVAAAQTRYEADQQSAAFAPPEAKPPMTVISQAVAAGAPLDDNLAGNQAIGFLAGLGLSLCVILLRKSRGEANSTEDHGVEETGVRDPVFPDLIEPASTVLPDPSHDPAAVAVTDIEARPVSLDEWAGIQEELALLRAKVQTYAARRHAGID
ncbi:succinoglycan biosynthesis transport protein [Rhizobium rhizogenes]|uniref:succinoglycan biosynthesis transport protein n=1 Tax=Rhizobium rhizogenes TaxID=359 RepID=UPI0022715835|nr:succinoglycan biosynthesis transport protein [Rhizobium rhizogenes]